MSNEELEAKILDIVRKLRPASRWSLEQWLRICEVEAPVPGHLISQKPARPGDPVEIAFCGSLALDTRSRYERPTQTPSARR